MQTYSIINFKVNLHNKVNSSVALRQIMYHSSNLYYKMKVMLQYLIKPSEFFTDTSGNQIWV